MREAISSGLSPPATFSRPLNRSFHHPRRADLRQGNYPRIPFGHDDRRFRPARPSGRRRSPRPYERHLYGDGQRPRFRVRDARFRTGRSKSLERVFGSSPPRSTGKSSRASNTIAMAIFGRPVPSRSLGPIRHGIPSRVHSPGKRAPEPEGLSGETPAVPGIPPATLVLGRPRPAGAAPEDMSLKAAGI
jgi:hypothetical protein